MKPDFETYCVRLGVRKGERYAERRALQIPWNAATGRYERLSNLALRELIHDLTAEAASRPSYAPAPVYDPSASQIRKPS